MVGAERIFAMDDFVFAESAGTSSVCAEADFACPAAMTASARQLPQGDWTGNYVRNLRYQAVNNTWWRGTDNYTERLIATVRDR